MPDSRRPCLQSLKACTMPGIHAGLWLDKYLTAQLLRDQQLPTGESTPQAALMAEIAAMSEPDAYGSFYRAWLHALSVFGADERLAESRGRLAIGLGAESVLETSVSLHRTYGMPYIPGSALKGLAARYARRSLDDTRWRKEGEGYRTLFGDTKTAGFVTFFDALYVPGSGHNGKALYPDVTTVHHPQYYQGIEPPADWDNPNPVPFLTATGQYLLALAGPAEWVNAAYEILGFALEEEGIGAKTSSGYGRLILAGSGPKRIPYLSARAKEPYGLAKVRLLKAEVPPVGRLRGEVVEVKQDGRYGFINPAGGGSHLFVHVSQVRLEGRHLVAGQVVEYILGVGTTGKPAAQEVLILLEP
jgi:CRISPR-associated protein Cmr6